MEHLKPYDTLEHVLCEMHPHQKIFDFVSSEYGTNVILTGIKDSSRDEVYDRRYTYGIPLKHIQKAGDMDLLDYALNTVVVYASQQLKKTSNGDYEVSNPHEAVLGFIELRW